MLLKLFFYSFGLFLALSASPKDLEEWRNFKEKHGKVYESEEEEAKRFDIFVENLEEARQLNVKHNGMATFGATVYSDLTADEFEMKHTMNSDILMSHIANLTESLPSFSLPGGAVSYAPASINWTKWGYATTPKNQGHCLSCYAFAAVGSVEAHAKRYSPNQNFDLSEQQVVACGRVGGCMTGWMHAALEYIQMFGIMYTSDYPYTAGQIGYPGVCHYNKNARLVRIRGFRKIDSGNEDDVKEIVGTLGPVAVPIDMRTPEYRSYRKGIMPALNCHGPKATNHAVLAVGYGRANGTDYWLMKDWSGRNWGEYGYFRIERNTGNKCAIATAASYPIMQ
ncbi:hypothetical protein L596_013375 [Steinernema carpocapsae]|uniref:Uncharacterized protein n=1 Tax=Steinernema carpocapsae TaxID=34508 RepID=A0A4U5NZY4_STECR|nr:hypothetical protein L596_013375 [Steinernema carpocapsae]